MVMGATPCERGPAFAAIAAAAHKHSKQVLESLTLNPYFIVQDWL
jgi:hypothetical protein